MAPLKKIVVQTWGSRGDVQPFIAISCALKAAGYEVHVATNINHEAVVEESGLEFAGIFLDMEKAIQEDPVLKTAMAEGDFGNFNKGFEAINKQFGEFQTTGWFKAIERIQPELIVSGTQCQIFAAIAERKMNIPIVNVLLQSIPENPKRMIFGLPNFPCCCNRLLIAYLAKQQYNQFLQIYAPLVKKMKGYSIEDFYKLEDYRREMFNPQNPTFIGVSPMVAKALSDTNSPQLKFCGPFVMQGDSQVETTLKAAKSGIFGNMDTLEAIKSFMEQGSKPVYLGWGSMNAKSPEYMVELVARAVKLAGSRGIVYQGWAQMGLETLSKATKDKELIEYAEKNILFVGKTPHDWLFPQCSCIVHHGGSGTMATAAKSGSPQIITPVFIDQWDHAHFLESFGAGVGFTRTQLTKVSAAELSQAIKTCESSAQIKKKAAEWAEISKKERACQTVVDYVGEFWSKKVETGEDQKRVAARLEEIKKTGR